MKSPKSRILFIVPYPQGISPGQRFRFEHYLGEIDQYTISSFLTRNDYQRFFSASPLLKTWILFKGYLRRAALLFRIHRYDKIHAYRETSPLGPPVLMWLNRIIWRKPFIYDFDDAIWLRDEGGESRFVASVKWKKKVRLLCSWASKVTVGNDYLATYARQYNSNVQVIPTVVDTERYHRRTIDHGKQPVIGWTGSHSTLIYIESVLPVLRKLRERFRFEFHIIANRNPGYPDEFIKFIPWRKESEIEDLQKFHIGIMPLHDNAWSQGKCGFKAIQYLALEIPAVVSPIGVNPQIVKNGESGFHASTNEEWTIALEKLLSDPVLRNNMGSAGREFIEKNYSVDSTREDFHALLN